MTSPSDSLYISIPENPSRGDLHQALEESEDLTTSLVTDLTTILTLFGDAEEAVEENAAVQIAVFNLLRNLNLANDCCTELAGLLDPEA